jgi:hypothetical protein
MQLFFTRHHELQCIRRLINVQYHVLVQKAYLSMQRYVVVHNALRMVRHFGVVLKASPL